MSLFQVLNEFLGKRRRRPPPMTNEPTPPKDGRAAGDGADSGGLGAEQVRDAEIEEFVDFGLVLKVQSTAIRELRYDLPTQTLSVWFHDNDKEYYYGSVDRYQARAFAEALSKGKFYNAEIKRGSKGLFGG